MTNKKKVLILSAVGVIYPFPEGDNVQFGLYKFLLEKGYNPDSEKMLYWQKNAFEKASRGKISSLEALKELLPSLHELELEKIESEFLNSNYFNLAYDFIETLEKIKEQVILGLLTNNLPSWSKYLIKRFQIEKYFHPNLIVISGEKTSYLKPEKEIYFEIQKNIDDSPQIYFVDDSKKNLKAADENLKWHTIYKDTKQKEDQNINYTPHHTI